MALLENTLNILFANPEQTLIYGLGASVLIVLADFETGLSINLPGRRRLGLAAIIALSAALIHQLAIRGFQGLLDQVSADIVSFGLIAVFIFILFRNRN